MLTAAHRTGSPQAEQGRAGERAGQARRQTEPARARAWKGSADRPDVAQRVDVSAELVAQPRDDTPQRGGQLAGVLAAQE